jgi:hypothetical protein
MGGDLRVIYVEGRPETGPVSEVILLVDSPGGSSQTVIVGGEPVEHHGYTFTFLGIQRTTKTDYAVLRIIDPQGQPIAR